MAEQDFRVKNGIIVGANSASFGTAATIAANGNIGISNLAPVHKLRVNGDISLSGAVHANGSFGATGDVLYSNGTVSYWAAPVATGVTQVNSGNGLTGGPITSTGTLAILANSG